jgi:hypothetical protein
MQYLVRVRATDAAFGGRLQKAKRRRFWRSESGYLSG